MGILLGGCLTVKNYWWLLAGNDEKDDLVTVNRLMCITVNAM